MNAGHEAFPSDGLIDRVGDAEDKGRAYRPVEHAEDVPVGGVLCPRFSHKPDDFQGGHLGLLRESLLQGSIAISPAFTSSFVRISKR